MGDRWTPQNAIDGRYIWLPIHFEGPQTDYRMERFMDFRLKHTILNIMTVIKCCIVGIQMYLFQKRNLTLQPSLQKIN